MEYVEYIALCVSVFCASFLIGFTFSRFVLRGGESSEWVDLLREIRKPAYRYRSTTRGPKR